MTGADQVRVASPSRAVKSLATNLPNVCAVSYIAGLPGGVRARWRGIANGAIPGNPPAPFSIEAWSPTGCCWN